MKSVFFRLLFIAQFLGLAGYAQEFKRILVTEHGELERLGLYAQSDSGHRLLRQIQSELYELGLFQNNYFLIFDVVNEGGAQAAILDKNGTVLDSIVRVPKEGAKCTSLIPVQLRELPVGGGEFSGIKGICGTIATIHSLFKLKLLKKNDAFEGKNLNPKKIKEVKDKYQKKFKAGMTMTEIANAHIGYSANECVRSGAVKVKQKEKLKRITTWLAKAMQEKKRPWDCTIAFDQHNRKGQLVFAHAEQVVGVPAFDPGSGGINVRTLNGFSQGKVSKKGLHVGVPAAPGFNTWYIQPGGRPACSLDSGASDQIDEKFGNVLPDVVEFVCCRPKKP